MQIGSISSWARFSNFNKDLGPDVVPSTSSFSPLHLLPLLPSELVIQSFNRNARGFPLFVYACALVSAPPPPAPPPWFPVASPMPFRWPTASAGTRFCLSLSLWLHQRAHNFKLALDATSEGLATGEEVVGGCRVSQCCNISFLWIGRNLSSPSSSSKLD